MEAAVITPTENIGSSEQNGLSGGGGRTLGLLQDLLLREEATSDCYQLKKNIRIHPLAFDGEWRNKLYKWFFDVVDHFEYDRDVVFIALNYLDRVLVATRTSEGQHPAIPKREIQLFATTCLYLAIKLHGTISTDETFTKQMLPVALFVKLSQKTFSEDTILATELRILNILKWRVNPSTCTSFIVCLLRLFPKGTQRAVVVDV